MLLMVKLDLHISIESVVFVEMVVVAIIDSYPNESLSSIMCCEKFSIVYSLVSNTS